VGFSHEPKQLHLSHICPAGVQISVNEVVDPWMVIGRLQTEMRTLKEALRQAHYCDIVDL
jgi:hypothetical protein